MRHTYLIARREYLSYVATPGFWISLAFVPIFLLLAMALPLLLEGASPVRYFAVIDDTGHYKQAIERRLEDNRIEMVRTVLKGMERVPGQEENATRALAVLDADGSVGEAEALAGQQARTALNAIKENHVLVAAPARTEEALRPFLVGEQQVDSPAGPKPLYAAAFIRSDDSGSVFIDYWSAAITETSLKSLINRAVRDEMRTEAFARAGVNKELVQLINDIEPKLSSLSPEKTAENAEVTASDRAPFFVAVFLAFILWSVVFSVANMLLTSTIEEKSGKVLDSLLSTAPVRALLYGKLLGVAAVSFTLLAGWTVAGGIAATIAGQFIPSEGQGLSVVLTTVADPGLLLPFLAYFVFGYLMFGAVFLALGSLCETLQEAQTLMSPLIFILMIPMLALAFVMKDPESPILAVLSWIPLFTPYIMLARLPTDPPFYEVIGTTLIMILTTIIVLWAAGRVFHAGAMHQAGVDYFKKLLKWRKAKPAKT